MKIVLQKICFSLIAFFIIGSITAQDMKMTNKAKQYIIEKTISWGLTKADVSDLRVSDQYVSTPSQATYVYFTQRYKGIDINNAISGVTITATGKVAYATNRFYSDIATKTNATKPALTAADAIIAAARYLKQDVKSQPVLLSSHENEFIFDKKDLTNTDIKVKLLYEPVDNGKSLRLAWEVSLDMKKTSDYWLIRIDALTGAFLKKDNLTVYCNFDGVHYGTIAHHEHHQQSDIVKKGTERQNNRLIGGGTYRVFPLPVQQRLSLPQQRA